MKKLLFHSLLLVATIASCSVFGAAGPQGHDVRGDRRDIRRDTRDIRHDRRDIRTDEGARRADVRDLRVDKREGDSKAELREDRKEIAGDTQESQCHKGKGQRDK